jgi:hypothetical protein
VTAACVVPFAAACTSIDPGPNYVVPEQDFNASYFYCFVEPNLIFGKKCGDNGTHGCHYSDKVPEMELTDHPPIQCANGQPVDPTSVGAGTPAANNYSAVSLEMDTDWMNAPIYIWPTQIVSAHPVQVFTTSDPVVQYISTWASL